METIGILVQKLGERSGVSQKTGNPWKMAEYLVEVPGQYPKKIKFDVSDGTSGKIAHFDSLVGKMVTVYWDIDASEYNGRWYTNVKAWRVEQESAHEAEPEPIPAPQPREQRLSFDNAPKDDDLPF